jgi:DNA-binding CsgD family transcriptional regulator
MRWLWLTYPIAGDLWDDEAWYELTTHAVRTAQQTGALNFLPLCLTYRAALHVQGGEFDVAEALVEEAADISKVTGNAYLGYAAIMLLVMRGEDADVAQTISDRSEWASTWGEGRSVGGGFYIVAVLFNALGRYQEALTTTKRAFEYEDLGFFGNNLVELIEAAARCDAHETAAPALRLLQDHATASGTHWALGLLARSKALLSAGETADLLYREAIEHLQRCRIAVDLARAHLVYGEWLRRENRRVDARSHLRTAYEMLRDFGATAFAERARRELLATGETVGKRTADAGGGSNRLTPQEGQIAHLARTGLSNPEIAAQLFLSPRTVEYHLSKVFTKLSITSRHQLARALPDQRHDQPQDRR